MEPQKKADFDFTLDDDEDDEQKPDVRHQLQAQQARHDCEMRQQRKSMKERYEQRLQTQQARHDEEMRRLQDELEAVYCIICHERPCVELIMPCKHLCMCATCVLDWVRTTPDTLTCPICREIVVEHYPVFIA